MRLNYKFFDRPTIIVARQLLGKYLVRRIGRKSVKVRIIETEAYCGPRDLACHASKGYTKRTKVMFGPSGRAYIYLIYGMYHCLNIVTEKEGYPAAVLIRAAEFPISNFAYSAETALAAKAGQFSNKYQNSKFQIQGPKLDGPGKLCRELKIDKKLNGIDMCDSNELWIEDGGELIKRSQIKKSKRIGVDYAGKWKNKLWRFGVDPVT